jgi:hypothetical protein
MPMDQGGRILIRSIWFIITLFLSFSISGCLNGSTESSVVTPGEDPGYSFAGGVKAVKIIFGTGASASFDAVSGVPTNDLTSVPPGYPGYDAVASYQYRAGYSVARYFSADSISTEIAKPAWIKDFQVALSPTISTPCTQMTSGYYEVIEPNCATTGSMSGTGSSSDEAFFRLVMDRNSAKIGLKENLNIQFDYSATGLRNYAYVSAGQAIVSPDDALDQVWKSFWSTGLSPSTVASTLGYFVPPILSACASGAVDCSIARRGRSQFIPLSALPTARVLQFSRTSGRSTAGFIGECDSSTPAKTGSDCVGIKLYSITIMRL